MKTITTQAQKKRIFEYLLQGHSITPLEALQKFGCFRLGARIYELKQEGIAIKSQLVECNGKRVAMYSLSD